MISITAFRSVGIWHRPAHGSFRSGGSGPWRFRNPHRRRHPPPDKTPNGGIPGSTIPPPAAGCCCHTQGRPGGASRASLFSKTSGTAGTFFRRSGGKSPVPIHTLPFRISKTPPVPSDRGRKATRYHLWFAASSRKRPRGVPSTPRRCNGRPRSTPTEPESAVRVPAPRCIRRAPSASFHRPEALLRAVFPGTSPHHCCMRYSIRFFPACQQMLLRRFPWE